MPPILPRKCTGLLPFTASLTSSTIWPELISTVRKACGTSAYFSKAAAGKGHSVIGLINPTFIPSFSAVLITFFIILATVPYAATMTSAPSQLYASTLVSFSAIFLYFSWSFRLCFSSTSGSIYMDVIILWSLFISVPVTAQLLSAWYISSLSLNSTASIICPSMPSPMIMQRVRYLSAMLKASTTSSYSSWTLLGASTTIL